MPVPMYGTKGKSLRDELNTGPEVLGTITDPLVNDPTPTGPSTTWQGDGPPVSLSEPPPPWELEEQGFTLSDARRFVTVPANWTLRWVNPRLVEANGWEHWKPVSPEHPDVTLKIDSMLCVDGTVRRGGATGDILAWMYTSWVESRRRLLAQKTAEQTQSAIDRQELLKEEFKRGKYGRGMTLEESRHPTHTMTEGRSLIDE